MERDRGSRRAHIVFALLVLGFAAFVGLGVVFVTAERGPSQLPLAGSAGSVLHPVAGAFVPDETGPEDCARDDLACLEQALGNVAYRQGPPAALELFDARLEADEAFVFQCHRIAHVIGSAALARARGDVARAFSQGSPTCASGYYHGILERAFAGSASLEEVARRARELCRGLRPFGYLHRQCNHGLGHGLMIQTGYHLPTALRLCAALPTRWDHLACSNGVFMENTDTRFGFRSRWLDDENPLYPCGIVSALDRRHCYARVPTQALRIYGGSFEEAGRVCARLAPRWALYCYRGLGRDAVGFAYDRKATLERCAAAGRGGPACLFGAARFVLDRTRDLDHREATRLCADAPPPARPACFAGIGSAIGLEHATAAERRRACESVTETYAVACARAAAAEVDPRAPPSAWG
ncbi:MAG: hypothetical protein RMM28_02635 [Thermoleophilia bacterium]|nr:hypothetical protein [Gaiellaceae bacterium]MDW8338020.1 hypothetical protein [Thermoleophilia bacterium]